MVNTMKFIFLLFATLNSYILPSSDATYTASSLYTPESCAKLLEDFQASILEKNSKEASAAGAASAPKISLQIVINQTDLESAIGKAEFQSAYKCSVDERLESLSKAFSGYSIDPEIIRLTNSTDISEHLQKYLGHDESYKGAPSELYKQLSTDATTGVCVNIETGELSWWSIPLSRVYSANPDKFKEYYNYKTTCSDSLRKTIKKKNMLPPQMMVLLMLMNTEGI